MSIMPNSHEVLLRNLEYLEGRPALLGVRSAQLLHRLPQPGLALTEHAGVFADLARVAGWQACYGYDEGALQPASCDSAVVFLPKARAELELRLALACWVVRSGGRILLIGEKKEGIAGAVRQFRARLADAAKVDTARHCQVWCATQAGPAPAFALSDWLEWQTIEHGGVALSVAGLPGVFSADGLDEGTALLLDTLADEPLRASSVLDFACGAGVIGAWLQLAARARGQDSPVVDGVDVQAQAVSCARETYRRNNCQGRILASDGLAGVEGRWHAVVTNPPFHSGIKTDTSMTERFLAEVSRHLQPGGELRLVANRFLPYEPLIARYVGPSERLAENRRYTVYRAYRPRKQG